MKNVDRVGLIGLRHCGKTTITNALSEETGKEVASTDSIVADGINEDYLVIKNGKPQVANISTEYYVNIICNGDWKAFRDKETDAVKHALDERTEEILDFGGGAMVREINREIVRSRGGIFIILLSISPEKQLERASQINRDTNRPSLGQSLQDIYDERMPIYDEFADFKIQVDNLTENEVLEEVRGIPELSNFIKRAA